MTALFSLFSSSAISSIPVNTSLRTPTETITDLLNGKNVQPSQFIDCLEHLYGPELVKRSISHLPERLDRRDCLAVLCHIGNSVTMKDLQEAWVQLRRNEIHSEILTFSDINPHDCDAMILGRGVDLDCLENLPFIAQRTVIQKLLDLYQNPLKSLAPELGSTLWNECERSCNGIDKTQFSYVRYHDYSDQLVARCTAQREPQTVEQEAIERAERLLAAAEQRTKLIGYAKPETVELGMVIPVFRPEINQVFYYKLEGKINQDGLHAYLFTPINRPGAPAQLIFRGTKGINSLQSDLDGSGIGKTRFEALSPLLLKMLSQYMDIEGPNSHLEIMGHSLGAADAQRAAALLVDLAAKNKCPLREIKVFAYASPKLDAETCEKWRHNLQLLADGRENAPQIELNFAHHVSDVLTWSGDSNLCGANAKFIKTNHLLVKSDKSAFKIHDHHTSPFFKPDGRFDFRKGDRTFTFYQDEIQRETEEKFHRLIPPQCKEEEGLDIIQDEEKELIQHLDALEKQKAEVLSSQKGSAQHSWAVWAISEVAGRPIKGFAYYSISLYRSLKAYFVPDRDPGYGD